MFLPTLLSQVGLKRAGEDITWPLLHSQGSVCACMTNIPLSHLKTYQTNQVIQGIKQRNGKISECSEGSGKAVEKPGKCNKSFCGFLWGFFLCLFFILKRQA